MVTYFCHHSSYNYFELLGAYVSPRGWYSGARSKNQISFKPLTFCYQLQKKKCWSYLSLHHKFWVIYYVIRDFTGQKWSIFDLVYLENNKIFCKALYNKLYNKSCLGFYSQQSNSFIFSLSGPFKKLRGQPLKSTFHNISKVIKNVWTLVEKNV